MTDPLDSPLRSSHIVAIALRLFAIWWMVTGVLYLVSSIGTISTLRLSHDWVYLLTTLIIPTTYGLIAFLSWIFAGKIAVKVTGHPDPVAPTVSFARSDLYGFGLLAVGLFYFLANLGDTIASLYLLALYRGPDPATLDPRNSPLHALVMNLLPCLAGIGIALCSPALGRKIADRVSDMPDGG